MFIIYSIVQLIKLKYLMGQVCNHYIFSTIKCTELKYLYIHIVKVEINARAPYELNVYLIILHRMNILNTIIFLDYLKYYQRELSAFDGGEHIMITNLFHEVLEFVLNEFHCLYMTSTFFVCCIWL